MDNRINWKEREVTIAGLVAFIAASLVLAEIFLYVYIRGAWEINLIFAIIMLLGGLIGFGNRWGGIILILVGIVLSIFGVIYLMTLNSIFFIYSPWFFLRDIGVSLEAILCIISGLLILDGNRRE